MIQKFVTRFDAARPALVASFTQELPDSYADLVRAVVETLHDEGDYGSPDPERITEIDHGDYQGTLLYVIGATGYQPSTYWAVAVSYGSCSGCDTLQAIKSGGTWSADGDEASVTAQQVAQFMTLATHIVAGIRQIAGYDMADGEPV